MSSLNKVMLIGRVGGHPERKQTKSDVALVTFSLATTESFKDRQGNRKEQAEWHNIAVWGKTAEIVQKYVNKGDLLYIEGKIQTDEYMKNDEKRYSTKVIAREVKFLTPREKRQGADPTRGTRPEYAPHTGSEDDSVPF